MSAKLNKRPDVGDEKDTGPIDDGGMEVDLSDDDDDEAGGDPEPEPEPERQETQGERQTRQQKKAGRWAEKTRETEEAKARAEAQRVRDMHLFSQQQQQPNGQQQTRTDPLEEEYKRIQEKSRTVHVEFNALPAAEQQRRYEEFRSKLEALKQEEFALVRRAGQGQQMTPQQLSQAMIVQQQQQMFPDIFSDRQMLVVADAKMREAFALGKPNTPATWEEVAEATRKQLGRPSQRRSPAPSAATRERYSGVPNGAGAGKGTGKVKLSERQVKMAMAAFPGRSKEEAVKAVARQKAKDRHADD